MAERPLLAMPRPERGKPTAGRLPIEKIQPASSDRQAIRLGPKFQRLEDCLHDPQALAELREDPAAIVPERALVFEVASDVVNFYQAVRGVEGLEFLGEDEDKAEPDEDFFVLDKEGQPRKDKSVTRRFYFTMPDRTALGELVGLWERYQKDESIGRGRKAWEKVFGYLVDIRPWGPQDRVTEDTIRDWRERLESQPEEPVRLEVEFWYRDSPSRRQKIERGFKEMIEIQNGRLIDSVAIDPIKYHAALVQVAASLIQDVLDHPEVGMAAFDDIMLLRPQSMISGPVEASLEDTMETRVQATIKEEFDPPVAALLDGVPMAQHERLKGRLVVDDPDEFGDRYGAAEQLRHATAMASLVLHGDLNAPDQVSPVRHRLYVRPVMYPQPVGFDSWRELMPSDRLAIDLVWHAFIRMFDGEGDEDATAPTVRVVNLSLGDANRRFTNVMSPWARLIDYLAWRYKVLILVSAGNILDCIPLDEVESWADFENMDEDKRQSILLRAILRHRASRRLLSPSEAINALTIGAAHVDHVAPNGHGAFAVDPYKNPHLPNPSSALGLGFKRTIKPEILFPGGAEQICANSSHGPIEVRPVAQPARYFGIGVASPGMAGQTNRQVNMGGTSVATALATHNALRILEALGELPDDPVHPSIEPAYHAVILKALLVHSARWNQEMVDMLRLFINADKKLHWEHERDEISRFLGFGCVDIERVVGCTEKRVTLIGCNKIHAREKDRFQVPLPGELEGVTGFRALSVTVAWLTPITLSHRMYRLAKFKVEPGGDKEFSLAVSNSRRQPSHNALGKGTVYHHRWEGEDAADFVDDSNLVLDVTCLPTTGKLDESIRYAVVASLEVGAEITVPIYERIRERLRASVPISA